MPIPFNFDNDVVVDVMMWFFGGIKFVKFLYDVDCSFLYQFLYLHRFPIIYLYH